MEFIYLGEVNVLAEQLDSFLLVAKDLQLKGLTALFDKEPNLFQNNLGKTLFDRKDKEYETEESFNDDDISLKREEVESEDNG